jgi:hypothetical protein
VPEAGDAWVAPARWFKILVGVAAAGSLVVVDATAVYVASAVAATTGASSSSSQSAAVAAAAAGTAKRVSEAPDLVSARIAARAQRSRVEAVSERTELLTTFVNPDGTLTTEASVTPVRFRDRNADPGQGGWRKVDLSLREAGGRVVTTASDQGVSLRTAQHPGRTS